MRLEIRGLAELRARLEQVRIDEVMKRALAQQAEHLAETVRDGLSEQPGSGAHSRPWAQTGALRDSIGAQAEGLEAAVGSSDPAAAPQEMGTRTVPPRPFLAPVAAAMGEAVANAIGGAVAAALGEETISDVLTPVSPPARLFDNVSAASATSRRASASSNIHLAAAGDLKCEGFSGGCSSGGSYGSTAGWHVSGRNLCRSCTVKMLGVDNEPGARQVLDLEPYELK